VSTFASGSVPEPGDQAIPPASVVLRCFNQEHALLEVERICAHRYVLQAPRKVVHPPPFANYATLIFVTGMFLASMARPADRIVRSRTDT
jgi:hypothetical protein